jgi:hypothetical protein
VVQTPKMSSPSSRNRRPRWPLSAQIIALLFGSLIMISLGIIGYYIARIYEEVKGRPRYVIEEFLG